QSGNIYGTTQSGPIFELVYDAQRKRWRNLTLYQTGVGNGLRVPGLIIDTTGNLYGLNPNSGTAYELLPQPGTHKRLGKQLFHFGTDLPQGKLTYQGAASGAPYDGVSPLYGTTAAGGVGLQCTAQQQTPCGSVFILESSGDNWIETTIYSFCTQTHCTDGSMP